MRTARELLSLDEADDLDALSKSLDSIDTEDEPEEEEPADDSEPSGDDTTNDTPPEGSDEPAEPAEPEEPPIPAGTPEFKLLAYYGLKRLEDLDGQVIFYMGRKATLEVKPNSKTISVDVGDKVVKHTAKELYELLKDTLIEGICECCGERCNGTNRGNFQNPILSRKKP